MSGADSTSVVPYQLVKSYIRVLGTRVEKNDPYPIPTLSVLVDDIHIEVVHRGDSDSPPRELRTGIGAQDVSIKLSPDARLQSIEYSHTGAGAAVVTAGAKLIAFVGSIAASVVRMAEAAPTPRDPRADWANKQPEAAALVEQNKVLAAASSTRLVTLRTELLAAPDSATSRDLSARIFAVRAALDAAREEVSRIEGMYLAWREAQRATTSTRLEAVIPVGGIPRRVALAPVTVVPGKPAQGSLDALLLQDYQILLEVVDSRPTNPGVWTPSNQGRGESAMVRWRVPRTVDLLVWKVDDGGHHLVQRSPITIADVFSSVHGMELRRGAFGKHGGSWTFGDDGAPSAIHTNDESAVAAFADALSSAPDTVVAAVEQANKLTDTIHGIQDAAAEREKSAAERELATAKAKVELLGINATADDAAALAKAEQAVKLRTASRSISPEADAVDDLKREFERLTTLADLESKRRQSALDGELATLKAEVARVEQEVLLAKAAHDKDRPDTIGE